METVTERAARWLVVTGDFVPTGGMDRANLALAEYLAQDETLCSEVHLVAHRSELDGGRVRNHRVPRPAGKHALGAPCLDHAGRHWVRNLRVRGDLRVLVNGGNCLAPATGNWVHYVHDAYEPPRPTTWRRFWHWDQKRRERIALQRADVIIANSLRTRQDIWNLQEKSPRHGSPKRVVTIYYGSDAERFPPVSDPEAAAARNELGLPQNAPVALFVGGLGDDRKGFATLFDAWGRLCSRDVTEDREPPRLLVAGSGRSLPVWRALADQAPWGDRITFLGFRNDIPRLLAAADLLISPTRYEAYGLNIHEALCRGRPVIASRNAGAAERLASAPLWSAMLLDHPEDPEELVAKFLAWQESTAFWRHAALRISKQLHAWTWNDCARSIAELLRNSGGDVQRHGSNTHTSG